MRQTRILIGLLLALAVAATACAPAAAEPAAPSPTPLTVSEDARPIFSDIQQDLALRAEIEADQIELMDLERVEWADAGLGCPLPGILYVQMVTEGYRIRLEAKGETLEYHTDTRGQFVLCQDDEPVRPSLR